MQTHFYVARGGHNSGPWTIEDIVRRLTASELAVTDFVFDEPTAAWIPILDSKLLIAAVRALAPTAPPPGSPMATLMPPVQLENKPDVLAVAHSSNEQAEWLVKRAERTFGPFTYLGLIRALQEKSVFEFDLVRRGVEASGKSARSSVGWLRIAELEEFSAERIRALATSATASEREVLLKRRFLRKPIEQDALIHDNNKAWIGKAFEASEGGCGMIVRNALLTPGQVINVHFGRYESLDPFNALCEVVSKRFVRDVRDARSPVSYGIKFLQVDPRVIRAAREYLAKQG